MISCGSRLACEELSAVCLMNPVVFSSQASLLPQLTRARSGFGCIGEDVKYRSVQVELSHLVHAHFFMRSQRWLVVAANKQHALATGLLLKQSLKHQLSQAVATFRIADANRSVDIGIGFGERVGLERFFDNKKRDPKVSFFVFQKN
ncbi:MAG: hypothetical protein JWP80_4833 [Pseudomonas sp.]|nr:hypothetical protein [Pseudomonas sp.]